MKKISEELRKKLDFAMENPLRMHVVKTHHADGLTDPKELKDAFSYHEELIRQTIIYSKLQKLVSPKFDDIYCTSGAIEQLGREPNEFDHVFVLRGSRYFQVHGNYITSEIWCVTTTDK